MGTFFELGLPTVKKKKKNLILHNHFRLKRHFHLRVLGSERLQVILRVKVEAFRYICVRATHIEAETSC